MVPDWSMDSQSVPRVPDWFRACIWELQEVVKPSRVPETEFKKITG
jgi:hypothetical protein